MADFTITPALASFPGTGMMLAKALFSSFPAS
jgi:hypothetical protein